MEIPDDTTQMMTGISAEKKRELAGKPRKQARKKCRWESITPSSNREQLTMTETILEMVPWNKKQSTQHWIQNVWEVWLQKGTQKPALSV